MLSIGIVFSRTPESAWLKVMSGGLSVDFICPTFGQENKMQRQHPCTCSSPFYPKVFSHRHVSPRHWRQVWHFLTENEPDNGVYCNSVQFQTTQQKRRLRRREFHVITDFPAHAVEIQLQQAVIRHIGDYDIFRRLPFRTRKCIEHHCRRPRLCR